jgi:hypothetical protein
MSRTRAKTYRGAGFAAGGYRGAGAAAVLAVSCAAGMGVAGCGIFTSPPQASGMEKQIVAGERVGAASRAHATRPGASAMSSSHAAVPGRDITAIGDSVMSASAPALADVLPGIYIDAKPDRQMPAGLSIVRQLAASGKLRPVVVMGLGTNYIVTTSQLQQLLHIIGPHRKLVLINTYVPDGWSKQVNATDAAFIREHPKVVLADWYDTIKNRLNLLWPDQVHPIVPGTMVYARVVDQAIQATRQPPGPASAGQNVVADNAGS